MWDLIWVSIQDFSKKAVFLAENAVNENARFSWKNVVMTLRGRDPNEPSYSNLVKILY